MAGEQVLLIDVSAATAATLADAGIAVADDLKPQEAAVALVGGPDGQATIARLRAEAPLLPIVTLGDATNADVSAAEENAAEAVRPWLADGMVAALERLGAVFGRETVAGLATGLAALLAEVDPDAMRAHRIAGLAGTLGLSALNRPWLAYSEGDGSALPTALRAAGRAREAIALFANA